MWSEKLTTVSMGRTPSSASVRSAKRFCQDLIW